MLKFFTSPAFIDPITAVTVLAGVFVLGRPNPSSGASAPAQALQAGSSHEHRHRIMSDRDPVAQSQLGVDPQRTIGAP